VAAERAVRPEGVFNHQSPSTDTTHSLCTRALLPLSLVPALSLHLSPTSTPTRAQVEVVVPAERPTLQVARWLRGPFALGSPSNAWGDRIATHLNTAVQLQHRRCSARCLARWASASASPFSQEDHPGRGLWQASPHVHSPALPTGELFSSDQDGLNALSLTRQCTVHALDDRSQLYACLGAWSTLSQRGAAASAAFWHLRSARHGAPAESFLIAHALARAASTEQHVAVPARCVDAAARLEWAAAAFGLGSALWAVGVLGAAICVCSAATRRRRITLIFGAA